MKLYYEINGEGYPIFLLHGNGENHHIYDELAKVLSKSYQCISVDSRYHGKSEKTGELTYEAMVNDIQELASDLNVKEYDVIGFSDGGIVALMLSLVDERLKHMITIGANTHVKALKPIILYTMYIERIFLMFFSIYHPKARLKLKHLNLMLKQKIISYDSLKDVRIPSLILCGENDMIKLSDSEMIAESLPYGVLKVIPNGTHFLLSDAFKSTSKEIIMFLNACHKVD